MALAQLRHQGAALGLQPGSALGLGVAKHLSAGHDVNHAVSVVAFGRKGFHMAQLQISNALMLIRSRGH